MLRKKLHVIIRFNIFQIRVVARDTGSPNQRSSSEIPVRIRVNRNKQIPRFDVREYLANMTLTTPINRTLVSVRARDEDTVVSIT